MGFADLKWFGVEGDYRVLVTDLLGPNLNELFALCGLRFSLKTVLLLADQLISRMKTMHSFSYTHGSVKPENVVIGSGETRSVVYMIDFGRSRQFQDPVEGTHISEHCYAGCYKGSFFSINTCKGIEYSRRDDMQSIGYMLMFFLRGSLPWQSFKGRDADTRKQQVSTDMLCRGYPVEFKNYLTHVESLEFEACPDYDYLRDMFKSLFLRSGYEDDGMYDWQILKLQQVKFNETSAELKSPPLAGEAIVCAQPNEKPPSNGQTAATAAGATEAASTDTPSTLSSNTSELPPPPADSDADTCSTEALVTHGMALPLVDSVSGNQAPSTCAEPPLLPPL